MIADQGSRAEVEATRRWIESIVIGLNLCPFARRVFSEEKIRYVLVDAGTEAELLEALDREMRYLVSQPPASVETTLLILPNALPDFLDFNDFLDPAEQLVEDLGYTGVLQIASFHPGYIFAGTKSGAVENYTNRSPYPMLHLLREESISNLDATEEELEAIPPRNARTLKALGKAEVLRRLAANGGGR